MRVLTKLVAVFIPLMLLVTLAVVFVSKEQVHRVLLEEVKRRGLGLSLGAAQTLGERTKMGHESKILADLQRLKEQTGGFYAFLMDQNGRVLAHTNVSEKDSVYHDEMTRRALRSNQFSSREIKIDGQPILQVWVPVLRTQGEPDQDFLLSGEESLPTERVGTLSVGIPTSETRGLEARIFYRQVWYFSLGIGILAVGLLLHLFRSVLWPVRKLVAGILRISQGKYGESIAVSSRDELGKLTECFNSMSQMLANTTVSKDYMDAIMEHMQDLLFILHPDGTIRSINGATRRLLGYTEEEALGQPVERLFLQGENPFAGKTGVELISEELRREWELSLAKKDGTTVPVLLSSAPLKDKEGQIVGVICAARDMTERKKLERTILQSEKLSAVGQLAAGVAHEINNPLGIILGFAQHLTSSLKSGDPAEVPLKFIEQESLRCQTLVQDLLTFSRSATSDRIALELNATMEGVIPLINAHAKLNEIRIEQKLAAGLPRIYGNKSKIEQVIINLANNAIDAMTAGGILTFETELLQDNQIEWVCLKVTDTGEGISAEILPRIFDPFFTTKGVGKGTGLGLSLVHEIMKSHSGIIEVTSKPGQTIFTARFPVHTEREMEEKAAADKSQPPKMPKPRGVT